MTRVTTPGFQAIDPTSGGSGATGDWRVPDIDFQRATVAFDDFCGRLHDCFRAIRNECAPCDLAPDIAELEAMLVDRLNCYVTQVWEQDAARAVGLIVNAIARPVGQTAQS